jgi:cytoskeletal protein RodZ
MMRQEKNAMGVGQRLRQAREARGLSTTEVAVRTKIPPWQLAALEAEQYERLPGGIFAKGHIRATAHVVGLDPAELSAHFDEEISPPPPPPVPVPMSEVDDGHPRLWMAVETREPAVPRPTGRLLAAGLIVISIVLVIVWFGRDRGVQPASGLETPARAQLASGGPAAPAPPGSVAVGTIGVTRARVPDSGIPMSIKAQRVCWLALTVDDQRIAYRMLQRGEKVSVRMRRHATLRTGDADALLVSIGNGPARALGPPGAAVRTIELTPEGDPRASTR